MTGGWGAGRTPITHRQSSTRNRYVATTQSQNVNRLMGGGSYDGSSEHGFVSIQLAGCGIAARPVPRTGPADGSDVGVR
jgi:hypothetical protein